MSRQIWIITWLVAINIATISTQVVAEPLSYYLPGTIEYDALIPTPASVIRHEVGDWHVSHDRLVQYFEALASASPRVSIKEYGRSFEGRPLILAAITHPDNQARLDEIRAARRSISEPNARRVDSTMPVVVWLGNSVHGNEPSGSNSALVTAYYWAAANSNDVDDLLRQTVILIDVSVNPDGLSRFSSWANSHKSNLLVTDRQHLEHFEAWPRGRTNHYWFDLNRDWVPLQMPESRARVPEMLTWLPNVITDQHEMGPDSTFFFQPGVPSRIHPLIPEENQQLTAKIAQEYARKMDSIGSLYYTRENYDEYYIGRGSTYGDFVGGIAFLFEQASARGYARDTANGLLTFAFGIRNQVSLAMTTVETAYKMRSKLLDYQYRYFKSAYEEAGDQETKAWIFGSSEDPARSFHLAETLTRHNIEVLPLATEITVGKRRFDKGAYVVLAEQAQYRLLRGLMEIRNDFEDNRFYDVSAWTLPLAFGLPYQEMSASDLSRAKTGSPVELKDGPMGEVVTGAGDAYAYVFSWTGYYAPRALSRLLDLGVIAKVATVAFTIDGARYDPGSIVIPMGIQTVERQLIEGAIQNIASEDAIDVRALASGYTSSGPDLGSRNLLAVDQPSVMVVAEGRLSAYEVGEVWHLFDQRYRIPISLVSMSHLDDADLDKYSAIILVDGAYDDVAEDVTDNIRDWIEAGGVLIAQRRAARFAADQGLSSEKFVKIPEVINGHQAYADLDALMGAQRLGGTIMRTTIDTSHPLGFGFADATLPVFKRGVMVMESGDRPFAFPVRYARDGWWSGYIPAEKQKLFDDTPAVAVSSLGRGRVISFVDNPSFRAFWYGTNKLLANAVFFGTLIDSASTR